MTAPNIAPGHKGFQTLAWPERFWMKVDRRGADECWPWVGATRGPSGRDYGTVWFEGRNRPSHQMAWSLANGEPFPDGMDGCHTCDNPPCCNPAHIFPGTAADNARDAVAKGRYVIPESPRRARCRRGHELTSENTYVRPDGSRQCRFCKSEQRRGYRARNGR